jgi:hypothetical protein
LMKKLIFFHFSLKKKFQSRMMGFTTK